MIDIDKFSYELPSHLIAQYPSQEREGSRMMVVNRKGEILAETYFREFPNFISSNTLLVFNNSKVFPARLYCYKETGGKVEILLVKRIGELTWKALLKGRKIREKLKLKRDLVEIEIVKKEDDGYIIKFSSIEAEDYAIKNLGEVPLPPYIKRKWNKEDLNRYQTVYASIPGSVAAPTAGFHFTKEILENLKRKGVQFAFITLHVGPGTFTPIRTKDITKHRMHSEHIIIDKENAEIIQNAIEKRKNIIAVGTTTTRTLEGVYKKYKKIVPIEEEIDLFIYPGFNFEVISGLLTNFHLPKSTLLVMISAFISIEKVKELYMHAIKKEYRFYSYGDCMLILPE